MPLIGVPMFGDQWYDVEKYEKHNIGLKLELELLDDEILENAINKVIDDDRLVPTNTKFFFFQIDVPINQSFWTQ